MTSRRRLNSWALGLLALGISLSLAQEEFYPTVVELERRGKKIEATTVSPDNYWVNFSGEIVLGQLEAVEGSRVRLKGQGVYWFNGESRILREGRPAKPGDFKAGEWLEIAFNSDRKDDEGNAFLMRMAPLKKSAQAEEVQNKKSYQYFAMSDAKRIKVTFGKDATAFGNLVLIDKGVEELVRLSDGFAREVGEGDDRKVEIEAKATPSSVEVVQGKSKAFGSELIYDNDTGDAKVAGPIKLERSGDKPLNGNANALTYNVDDETLLLSGQVRLTQKERTTSAQSAVVREKDGVAYLYGTKEAPVTSESKDGKVRGTKLKYNLDTGDVVVLEGIEGEFQD
ncbi:MAG: hypothetical protein C4333_00795 [Meiothermus sp.]